MKKNTSTLAIISIVLLSTLLLFTGCSDMMEKLGNISLTIILDTPEVEVASYTLEGSLSDTTNSFTLDTITLPKHTLSTLKKGTWNLTVKAFDESSNQIGIGTRTVELKEGQVADTTLLVVFSQSSPRVNSFTISAPARFDAAQGTITGTTTAMEYKIASASEETAYTACTGGSTLLAPGSYRIRYAAAHGLEASEPLTVTVPTYQPIQLTITNPTLTTTKVYDRTNAISGNVLPGPLTGVLEGDEVAVLAQATYDSSSVGNSKTITVTYSLSGSDASNYIKPVNTTVSGVIQPKQLTVTGTSVTASKVYDNSTSAAVENAGNLVGVIDSEQVSVTASAAYRDKTVGTGKQITVVYSLSGTDANNYTAPLESTVSTGSITARQLTVTVGSYTKIFGQANPSFSVNVTGFVNGENTSTADGYSAPTASTTATTTTGAGTYVIAITGGSATNYTFDTTDKGTLIINKATYDMSGISFNNSTVTYNGTEQSLLIAGMLPSGVSVSYSDNAKTNAGTYTATARFSGDSSNYEAIADKTATLTINKATYDMTEVSFGGSTVTYDGTTKSIYISGLLPSGVSVSYTNNEKTDAGIYTVTAHFTSDSSNYEAIADKTATLTIEPLTMTGSVTLTGSWAFGETLTAVPNLTNAGPAPTYIWLRNGGLIAGATSSTYTLTAADIGYSVEVAVNATAGNYAGQVVSSAANISKAAGSSISGTPLAFYPTLPATQTIINLTDFTANLSGLEARVALNGTNYGGYADLEIDSRGRAMILMSTPVTTAAKVQVRYKATTTANAGEVKVISVSEQNLAIGDYYAGGIVAYFYSIYDPGYVENELHGLIAAESDITTGVKWSSNVTLEIGTSDLIRTGSTNTDAIIAALDNPVNGETGSYAAKEARSYEGGGYTDWFLPSLREILRVRDSSDEIGNFNTVDGGYMTSTESTQFGWDPAPYYHVVYYYPHYIGYDVWDKYSGTLIRPLRYF